MAKAKRRGAAGVDGVTLADFASRSRSEINRLALDLQKQNFEFSLLRCIPIAKANSTKKRIIAIPTIRDRIVQRAIISLVEQKGEKAGLRNKISYGFVRSTDADTRGVLAARSRACVLRNEAPWCLKTDISAFFDRIERPRLLDQFKRIIRAPTLDTILEKAIHCEIEADTDINRRIIQENGIKAGIGIRQGMPLSPFMSNLFLKNFDQKVEKSHFYAVRYADDIIFFCKTQNEAEKIHEFCTEELSAIGLELSEKKTSVHPPDHDCEFLGLNLSLDKSINKYRLFISEQQKDDCVSRIRKFRDWTYCMENRLNISTSLRKMRQMADGFISAFEAAHNVAKFADALEAEVQTSSRRLYASVFPGLTPKIMAGLDKRRLEFLMLGTA